MWKLKLCLISFALIILPCETQVNKEIFDPNDLLAVESLDAENEVIAPPIPIQDAPEGFGGQRLTASAPASTVSENVINPDGTYRFSYQSPDGSYRREEGKGGVTASGEFGYVGDDGKTYSVTYHAGEEGFVVQGEHLPVPPPLPPALQRWEDAKTGKQASKTADAVARDAPKSATRQAKRIQGSFSNENFYNLSQRVEVASPFGKKLNSRHANT